MSHLLSVHDISLLVDTLAQAGEVVLIGGAAMCAHQLDRDVHDVDAYLDAKRALPLKNLKRVDVTNCEHLWGRMRIGDVKKSPVVTNGPLTCRAISLETLFIMKADAARDKDIEDLPLLVDRITPESVARRLGELRRFNDEDLHADVAETVLMELQLHFGVLCQELLAMTGLSESRQEYLASIVQMYESARPALRA